jgi:hypothetical protein
MSRHRGCYTDREGGGWLSVVANLVGSSPNGSLRMKIRIESVKLARKALRVRTGVKAGVEGPQPERPIPIPVPLPPQIVIAI